MLKASVGIVKAIAPYRSAMAAANGAYRYIRVYKTGKRVPSREAVAAKPCRFLKSLATPMGYKDVVEFYKRARDLALATAIDCQGKNVAGKDRRPTQPKPKRSDTHVAFAIGNVNMMELRIVRSC